MIFLKYLNTPFFCNIFLFVLELFTRKKTYFINYNFLKKSQTNKQTNKKQTKPSTTHFARPSTYWKPSSFPYSLVLILTPYLDSKAEPNQVKCRNILVFKTFSTCCHLLLYIVCFFHCLLKFFPLCFYLSWFF